MTDLPIDSPFDAGMGPGGRPGRGPAARPGPAPGPHPAPGTGGTPAPGRPPAPGTAPGTGGRADAGSGPPAARRRTLHTLAALPALRRSWFATGFALAAGALAAWLLVRTVLRLSELLTLLLVSAFIAVGLEPVVGWLCRRGLRRGWSVLVVAAGFTGLLAGFVALVIPPVSAAVTALTADVPRWREQLRDHHSTLGRLEDHYHVIEKAQAQLGSGGGSELAGGVLGAGQLVLSALTSAVIVVTVTLYVMLALPAIKRFCYRFVPGTRRPHAEAVCEEILVRVGRFMLGNVATSAVAGAATFAWCAAWGVPYPSALGFFVALMDMVPVVGSTVGGVAVSLVALSVSLPVAVATALFYVGFRLAEDYLIMPRAMKFAVDVHPVVTVVAVLAGGSLLGIVGGLVAIPAAVAVGIVLEEYVFPRIDAG
ncbi:AI-2E family transporter [Actinacidiphila guanduensis]|uniref:Predicted PurR-regulated permease PerM n=1 Tax=Actinacidiphila guanduensis TaxID=310781 RepID=A0A1H0MXG0_9ACTN|nr:AI-2E family transporter [Actinacidiphila guanduensis]SDO84966.1 Predicted PurR-regulated permease PerM [Actinacidiphila guanduensis]